MGSANSYRVKHLNTPSLTWDAELADKAEKWAKELLKSGNFKHDPDNNKDGTGENMFIADGRTDKSTDLDYYCGIADGLW